MSRKTCIFLQFLAFCVLIELSYVNALIGRNVRTAHATEFSFVVSISRRAPKIRDFQNLHLCTGTLLSRRSVLTAAHCLLRRKPSDIEIVAGNSNLKLGKKYYPETWITYDKWKYGNDNQRSLNDIAIIQLEDEGVPSVISLASIRTYNSLQGYSVSVAGWGITGARQKKSQYLKRGALMIISAKQCNQRGRELKPNFSVHPHYVCAVTQPWIVATTGDDGAPVLDRGRKLVGIITGVAPKLGIPYNLNFLKENLLNAVLNLNYYTDFINSVKL